jgi:thiol-disulfide isomerase/thioredoxin
MGARRIAAYWAVAVAAALAAGCSGSSPDDGSAKPDPNARKPGVAHETLFQFEAFTSAPLVGGGEVTVESLRGQVVLLDIFGTWCGPCRKSTPIMVSLYERFRGKRLAMVGLAKELTNDAAQAAESVRSFREEFKVPYRLALCPDTIWDDLTRKAKVDRVVPTILLVDRHGVVRYLMQGYDPGGEAALADAIEKLLAEPTGPAPAALKAAAGAPFIVERPDGRRYRIAPDPTKLGREMISLEDFQRRVRNALGADPKANVADVLFYHLHVRGVPGGPPAGPPVHFRIKDYATVTELPAEEKAAPAAPPRN